MAKIKLKSIDYKSHKITVDFWSKIITTVAQDTRKIVVYNNVAFYQSTGNNSKSRGTFLPMIGVCGDPKRKNPPGRVFPGYISKAFLTIVDQNEGIQKANLSPYDKSVSDDGDLKERFGSVELMVVSAMLGGGFWETSVGIDIKASMQQDPNLKHMFKDE